MLFGIIQKKIVYLQLLRYVMSWLNSAVNQLN